MEQTIKTLILEAVTGSGPGHIREIHLKVTGFRPEVPQHTVRARLSEMSRARTLKNGSRHLETVFTACIRRIGISAALSPIPTVDPGGIRATGGIVQAIWSKT